MPFDISSAPEHFHRRVNEILSGLEGGGGVDTSNEDILVFGRAAEEQDAKLMEVLIRLGGAEATLNEGKCPFDHE